MFLTFMNPLQIAAQHTMEGIIHDEATRGIIPRAVEALFDAVSEADESIEFTFKVTYVEIYMEKVRDLLDETRTKVNLTIREDKIKGIYIGDVTEEYVTSQDELLDIMADGEFSSVLLTSYNIEYDSDECNVKYIL
jgi:kinesin family member 5